MERGLIWLPLLILIIGLTWVGWKEYQKVEAYRIWSEQFEQAKYDIYAVMGVKNKQVTWGKPTFQGIIDIETFALAEVTKIELKLSDLTINSENLPTEKSKDTPQLTFYLTTDNKTIQIPFTELELAAKWQQYLISQINEGQNRS